MAPQRPESKQRSSRPSSGGPPSPTKPTTPRKSGDTRRRSGADPKRRSAQAATDDEYDTAGESPRKGYRSGDEAARRQQRRRRQSGADTPTRGSPTKDRDSPTKPAHSTPSKDPDAKERERRRRSEQRRRSASGSPTKKKEEVREKHLSSASGASSSVNALSADSLARLNQVNAHEAERDRKRREKEKVAAGRVAKDRDRNKTKKRTAGGSPDKDRAAGVALLNEKNLGSPGKGRGGGKKRARDALRAASGSVLELGGAKARHRGGYMEDEAEERKRKKRRWMCIGAGVFVLLLIILVPVGVLVVGKQNNSGGDDGSDSSGDGSGPNNSNLNGLDPNSIPASAKGGYYDPFSWYDTQDFNVTYTTAKVGGLPIMGLNSTWDDSVQANSNVPPLDKPFGYGTTPIRGVNVGGWLAIEPFITPSLFDQYDSKENVVDEYTLCEQLGPTLAAQTLEKHYSQFINAQAFADIRAAGFDHVRMPYSYWAITTYPGDPYVAQISWRYLLRGIEYARENGLRVNLDLHGLPGSQNGWNHSGRQGTIGWLNGTDGTLNGQRSLDIHKQLSTFFAQDRYKNVIGIYGLVNEPKMISLPTDTVLEWTTNAINIVRGNGIDQWIAFGDGFLGLPNWKGKLQGNKNLVMDAHQYVIFNADQIAFDHKTKLNFACSGWSGQMQQSTNTDTGFGPTLCGEWSQADTDCTQFLNNVNVGSRWTGTMNVGDPSLNVLTPSCTLKSSQCSCDGATADSSSYSDGYKQWLLWNAEAQMDSFEIGLGWFYWTWLTESATQWSWKLGMEAGILPDKVWDREFNCSSSQVQNQPDWGSQGLPENY